MFIDITMFTCIRPVKFNVQIINGSKAPVNGFVLFIIKNPKINIIIPLWTSYYIPQTLQDAISKTAVKNYNLFRSVGWLQIATDTGMKLKVETTIKEIDQQFWEFITIGVLKIEYQRPSIHYIINLTMTPIIKSYFIKHPMLW